jgi:hypothetical protein
LSFLDQADESGWDTTGKTNVEILDLLDGLRQAGLDGDIKFFGKRNHRRGFETLTVREPLRPIDMHHWAEFEIYLPPLAYRRDNFDVRTQRLGVKDIYEGGFSDLHLDGQAAVSWLKIAAATWKGRRDRLKGRVP